MVDAPESWIGNRVRFREADLVGRQKA